MHAATHASRIPAPGSDDAVTLGCTCPRLDNGHGAGRGDGRYWITGGCPLHGVVTHPTDNGEDNRMPSPARLPGSAH